MKEKYTQALGELVSKCLSNGGIIAGLRAGFRAELAELVNAFREEWANRMIKEMKENYPNSTVLLNDSFRRVTVVQFADFFGDVCGVGVALCSQKDCFDYKTGVAVAYAKFSGQEIPEFV